MLGAHEGRELESALGIGEELVEGAGVAAVIDDAQDLLLLQAGVRQGVVVHVPLGTVDPDAAELLVEPPRLRGQLAHLGQAVRQ